MIREIRFRGKHLVLQNLSSDWVFGSLYSDGADDLEPMIIEREGAGRYYPVDPTTVGQFTGLTDKDGNEIYEGDIVAWDDGTPPSPSAVRWDSSYGSFVIMKSLLLGHACKAITVIGNIHDNPELLEDMR